MMRRFSLILPFTLVALALLVVPIQNLSAPITRYFTINAAQFEFMPGRLAVNQGDHVVITVAATDVVHGFYLDGYGLDERVEPGLTKTIEFVAGQAGKFRYRCSVTCGSLHPFMIGELVVGPNTPFWRSVGILAFSLAGMLVDLWRSTGVSDGEKQKAS